MCNLFFFYRFEILLSLRLRCFFFFIVSRYDFVAFDFCCVISLRNEYFSFLFSQSTPTSYEHFTREVLNDGEAARQRSIKLRSTLNDIYVNSIKDLRDQATRVDIALAENVKLTQDCLRQLEIELLRVRSANATKDGTRKILCKTKSGRELSFCF